jgi:hypothetical protein
LTPNLKINTEQKAQAYILYSSGHSQNSIIEQLRKRFTENTISLRTLNRWIFSFKKLPGSVIKLENPFQWDKCDDYDIPWANSLKLLELCHHYYENEDKTPSVRQAKWWWRVSQAAPDLRANQIAELGNLYAEREIEGMVSGNPPVFDDLNAYITYKPYHTNRTRTYARFINAQGVKPVKPKNDESNARGGLKNAL